MTETEEPNSMNTHYRNLYQKHELPDNFTDADFLARMRVNPHFRPGSFVETALSSSRIEFQLCSSVLFYAAYHHLNHQLISPETILLITLTTTTIGYLFYRLWIEWPISNGLSGLLQRFPKEHVRVTIVYLIFSYQLAPILRTLTVTISTDTIHATSVTMVFVHLLTNDYGMSSGFMVSKTVSVNAAVIGSICLASRMSSDFHSIALLTFAVETFVLFPIFSRILWNSSVSLALFVVITAVASMSISSSTFLLFVLVTMFIIMILPLIFIISCKFKANIYGPWDEAVPRAHDDDSHDSYSSDKKHS